MKKPLLFFLFIFIYASSVFSQDATNTATKEETIQWLISKITQNFENPVFDKSGSSTKLQVEGSNLIIKGILSHRKDEKSEFVPSDSNIYKFDFKRFNDYSFKLPDEIDKSRYFSRMNYILILKCSGCVLMQSTYHADIYFDEISVPLSIDEKTKARFIKALDHLKALSKNNKEKF